MLIIKERQIKTPHFTAVRMAAIKKNTTRLQEHGEKGTLYTVDVNVNWCSHLHFTPYYERQYGGFTKTKTRTTIWPSNSTPGYISAKTFLKNPLI